MVEQLPSTKCLKRTIQRARKAVEASPASPESYNFEIPNTFKTTLDKEQFLLFDMALMVSMTIRFFYFQQKKV